MTIETPVRGEYPEEFFDQFWGQIAPSEDDTVSAVRLIAEMFARGVIHREGDEVWSADHRFAVWLSVDDQYLVRTIEDATEHAIQTS